MDQRLAVETHIAALGAFGRKSVEVAEIVADTVKNVDAAGTGGNHHLRQQRREIAPVGCRADAGLLDEVVGAGDEAAETSGRIDRQFGDGAEIEHRTRGLDHRPELHGRIGVGLVECLVGGKNIARPIDLGQQDGIRPAGTRRQKILRTPFARQGVDADHQLRVEIALPRQALPQCLACRLLVVRGNRVLEVDNHCIAVELRQFRQRFRVGRGHIEYGAAGSVGTIAHAPCLAEREKRRKSVRCALAGPPRN